ncbi:hypothetical protein SAMN04488033_10461 [Salegentibacter agarivorans]|uniref:Fibronectin type-III domain-containing protein n=1 Tax=Salegentibacter agarivorans TaxID=345907 RepID=A0A1I2KMJ8_9FLAO|nr:hypothetical protein [Salegentibacter agarivorans]SFF68204.1 hypothetical protein SAMN04488033_10461 [Salegentibacter agarivorans]
MKKINLLIGFVIFVAACTADGEDEDPIENQAPSQVDSLIYPSDNLLCADNTIDFEWEASTDPDGDDISYLLEITRDIDFSTIDHSFTLISTSKSTTLEKDIAYYWRVKAIDSKNLGSDYSTVYQFYTEGVGETNHIPFAPELIAPSLNEVVSGTSSTLEWDANDVDNDPLIFDIYFDTENPPITKIGDNQSDKTLSVDINAVTTYYWKVVAKDGKGGQSVGQVWSFSTN